MATAQFIRCAISHWRWQLVPEIEALESTRELEQQGYHLVPDEYPLAAACIAGQLGRLRRIQVPGKPTQLFASEQALTHALAYPVVLTMRLPEDLLSIVAAGAGTLLLSGELPLLVPPRLGQVGLLAEVEGWRLIPSEALDAEAQQNQREIEHLLREIQRNPAGEPFATFGPLCYMGGYPKLQQHWQEALQHTQLGVMEKVLSSVRRRAQVVERLKQQKQLQQQMALLEQAARHIKDIRGVSGEEKLSWQAEVEHKWPELQARVQSLAASYYHAAWPGPRQFKLAPRNNTLAVISALAPAQPLLHVSHVQVLADPVSQILISALRDRQHYQFDPQKGAFYQATASLPAGEVRVELAFPESPTDSLEALNDALIDTWLVIQHQALEAQDLSGTFTTSLDTLLSVRGRQPAQKIRSLQFSQLRVLAQAEISLWLPQMAASREPMRTPLLHLTTIEGEPSSQLLQLALGTWVRLVPREVVRVPRMVLELHPRNYIAKRLALWAAFHLHHHPDGVDIQMRALLEQAGISYHNKDLQIDTRDNVTRAFKRLARIPLDEEGGEQAILRGNKRLRSTDEDILWEYHGSAHDPAAVLGQFWVKRANERVRKAIPAHEGDWFDTWLSLIWHLVPPTPPVGE